MVISRRFATAVRMATRCSIPRTSTSASVEDCLEPRRRHSLRRQRHRPRLAQADARSRTVRVRHRHGAGASAGVRVHPVCRQRRRLPKRTATSTWAPDSRSTCPRKMCRRCWTWSKVSRSRAARGTCRNESRQARADRPERPRVLQRHARRQVKGVRPHFYDFRKAGRPLKGCFASHPS